MGTLHGVRVLPGAPVRHVPVARAESAQLIGGGTAGGGRMSLFVPDDGGILIGDPIVRFLFDSPWSTTATGVPYTYSAYIPSINLDCIEPKSVRKFWPHQTKVRVRKVSVLIPSSLLLAPSPPLSLCFACVHHHFIYGNSTFTLFDGVKAQKGRGAILGLDCVGCVHLWVFR